MADLTLYLGNKNYSSWSLRPWLLLKQIGAGFDEVVIPLYRADSKPALLGVSPSGKVPVLRHQDRLVWDSLAICGHLAETFPQRALWPRDPAARAAARSVSAEMHAGFADLRREMPMNVRAHLPGRGISPQAQAEVDRVAEIWRDCRTRFGAGGDFLFGGFTIADAMYAPVASRFHTYATPLDPICAAYRDAILALPAMHEWTEAARAEPWVVDAFER